MIFSDPHISAWGPRSRVLSKDGHLTERCRDTMATSHWLSSMTHKYEPDYVIVCGDNHHEIGSIDTLSLDLSYRFWDTLVGSMGDSVQRMYVMTGGHDYHDKAGQYHSVGQLNWLNRVQVVDLGFSVNLARPSEIPTHKIRMIPYCRDSEDFYKTLGQIDLAEHSALFIHQDLMGAVFNGNIRSTDGIDPSRLSGVPAVFAGHYHLPQEMTLPDGRLYVVGSMMSNDYRDLESPEGIPRGCIIADFHDDRKVSVVRLENLASPIHATVRWDSNEEARNWIESRWGVLDRYCVTATTSDDIARYVLSLKSDLGADRWFKELNVGGSTSKSVLGVDQEFDEHDQSDMITAFRQVAEELGTDGCDLEVLESMLCEAIEGVGSAG